jgi:hypothetical protein
MIKVLILHKAIFSFKIKIIHLKSLWQPKLISNLVVAIATAEIMLELLTIILKCKVWIFQMLMDRKTYISLKIRMITLKYKISHMTPITLGRMLFRRCRTNRVLFRIRHFLSFIQEKSLKIKNYCNCNKTN